MKKNLLKILLCASMLTVTIVGCGSSTEATIENDTVTLAEEEPAEEPTEEIAEETTEEPAEESAEAEEPMEEPAKDWFGEHGLVITPQGDFTFTTMGCDDSYNDVKPFEVKANAAVSETTDGVEDGYKKVTMVWNIDASAVDGTGYNHWESAFDRYTGISFEADSSVMEGTYHWEGFFTIVNGDESYDVSIATEVISDYPKSTDTLTVTCPVDYDGVVFQIGYWDQELREANQAIDYTARLYTIDELPAYGNGYHYFSYSDE